MFLYTVTRILLRSVEYHAATSSLHIDFVIAVYVIDQFNIMVQMASSFRQTKVASDGECSDSDEDGRPTLKRYRPEPPDLLESVPSGQRSGGKFNIWSDVLTDQTLSAQMSSNVEIYSVFLCYCFVDYCY